jgi:hypothetical protein
LGVTQPDGVAAGADAGVAPADPVGATQPAGADAGVDAFAEPVGATQLAVVGAEAVAAPAVPVGVDCNLASNPGEAVPSTGSAWDCSKAEIAARVFGPMKPSAVACR